MLAKVDLVGAIGDNRDHPDRRHPHARPQDRWLIQYLILADLRVPAYSSPR